MIIRNICDAENFETSRLVVALGNFDGVHFAHTKLIRKAKDIAFSLCSTAGEKFLTAVFTFSDLKKPYITTADEKLELFEKLGVDIVFLSPFDSVKDLTPEQFVRDILVSKLSCAHTVCGFNYRFGKNASGNTDTLSLLAKKYAVSCTVIPEISGVSSTRVRELLANSEVENAAELLGRPFSIRGSVVHGRGVGHSFGCPTLNIEVPGGKLIPANGVYFTLCRTNGKEYPSVTNIGTCPTFDDNAMNRTSCECHLIDTCEDLYGSVAEVIFLKFRRPEQKFSSASELYETVSRDISAARDFHISKLQ